MKYSSNSRTMIIGALMSWNIMSNATIVEDLGNKITWNDTVDHAITNNTNNTNITMLTWYDMNNDLNDTSRWPGRDHDCGGNYQCDNMEQEAFVSVSTLSNGQNSDYVLSVWGWTSPSSRRSYALVGMEDRTAFVEVTNPSNPTYLGYLYSKEDNKKNKVLQIQTYGNYAYIRTYDRGVQVFDVSQLDSNNNGGAYHYHDAGNFLQKAGDDYDNIPEGIFINTDTGFLYATGLNQCKGLRIYDLKQNPTYPTLVNSCFQPDRWIASAHCVIYKGNTDSTYANREICFAPAWDEFSIIDVTDKRNPVELARLQGKSYDFKEVVQGYLTADQKYFVMADQYKDRGIYVIDVRDLNSPYLLREFGNYNSEAYLGNSYVVGDYVYQVNHNAGLRVYEITGTGQLNANIAYYDTIPYDNDKGDEGVMDAYPFFTSLSSAKIVLIVSKKMGLFVVRPTYLTEAPSQSPSISSRPSSMPTSKPSAEPTVSLRPSSKPSPEPSSRPTVSMRPSSRPSSRPTLFPTHTFSPTRGPPASIFDIILLWLQWLTAFFGNFTFTFIIPGRRA